MSAGCGNHHCDDGGVTSPAYRRVLWICLAANGIMFAVQIVASYAAHSVALLANSLDFLSDAANYGISIYVLGHTLAVKARASIFKGLSMGLVGVWAAWETFQQAYQPVLPEPMLMTIISAIALAVNLGCTVLLYKFRAGDSNARSVWICSRNDALGNIAVMFAAGGVFAFATVWPDIIVATILAGLALHATWEIIRDAKRELKHVPGN